MPDLKRNEARICGLPSSASDRSCAGREPLELLGTRFVEAIRAGKRPDIEDVAVRYPELADEVRGLFPLLVAMESWKGYREHQALEHRALRTLSHSFREFRIVRQIGRGGMGIVFEAREQPSDTPVAVKVLPFLTSPALRSDFVCEARTAARLRHPHVVPVLAFGEHEGLCYYVMPLIAGAGLDWIIDRLRRKGIVHPAEIADHFVGHADGSAEKARDDSGPFGFAAAARDGKNGAKSPGFVRGFSRTSWAEMARIGAQVADAIAAAHARGTLHRDIKPGNILVEPGGEVWITDFGVAKTMDTVRDKDSHAPAGTLRYMAPEEFAGRVGPSADVYSLGATLYELTTRTPPFLAVDRQHLVESITHSPPPRPREVNAKIPRDLEAIILKAMAVKPSQRYQSAAALRDDLNRFRQGVRVRARGAAGWLRLPGS